MTKFVMRGGHMVSTERAAILDGLAPGEEAQTQPVAEPVRQEQAPPRPLSERLAEPLTRAQKAAATRAANRAAAAAAAAEPLRPQNIDPATGEVVILREVKDPVTGDITQVPVEPETGGEPEGEEPDPFDAAADAAEAAAGAGADAPADEAAGADLEADAVADAG